MNKIGIISALGREIKFIKDKMEIIRSFEIKGYRFSEGILNNQKIILGITSVGKVNAALCTEILINNFNPSLIINTGIAGALNKEIEVLDIIVSEKISFYDVEDYILKGCYPHMPSFSTDTILYEKAQNASKTYPGKNKIYFGKIISGDSFISSKEEKNKLISLHNPLCVEMEGAAIAHTCHINKTPFISFRCISDNAGDSAREIYKENEILAANEAGKFVLYFLKMYNCL